MSVLPLRFFGVLYLKGKDNHVDAFTRIPWQGIVDEEEEHVKQPLVVLRLLRTALSQANIHIKVSVEKLLEWQQETIDILARGWKLPPLYKSIAEGYADGPNFTNLEWINMHKLHFKNGLWYKNSQVDVPNILGIEINILVEHHDSIAGGHLGVHKTKK